MSAYLTDWLYDWILMDWYGFQTLINMAYCILILLGKTIQKLVFGELRPSERQHLKDKFWNFVFHKFIFVFGVLNVQYMDEVVLWCAWFTALGFLSLLSQLCKDRFEYVSLSPSRIPLHFSPEITLREISKGTMNFYAIEDAIWFIPSECYVIGIAQLGFLFPFLIKNVISSNLIIELCTG